MRVHQINMSTGGVPKLPVDQAEITSEGLIGDVQRDRKHHGGPMRAVCLFSLEVIERLASEGHPISPGTVGENLTLAGADWSLIAPGVSLRFEGGVELEVTSFTRPCANIRDSFKDLDFRRIQQDEHPGESRVYTRVLHDGMIRRGEGFELVPCS